MSDRAAKDALYDGFSVVAKAMANGRRAEIVDVLSQGERSVEELATEIGQSVANTSQHLRHLAGAGLVRTYYVYADDAVRELHRRGLPARRLEDGYPEWVDAGLPTAPG